MIAVMLFMGYYGETVVTAPPPLFHSLATVGGFCLGLLAVGIIINGVSLWLLRRRRVPYHARRRVSAYADMGLRILLVGFYILVLTRSDLPWAIAAGTGWRIGPDTLALQFIGLALYLAFFFAAWLPMYGLHREVNYGNWTRLSFLVHKARYNLYMLLAWIPFAILADWFSEFLIILPLLFLLAAWIFPYLLAKAWGCKRLPEGEVMDRVRRLEQKAGAGFSRVYLWEPGGGNMQNAAAVGIFRPFRYLFLTPALVRNMPGPELEAVILHELGHVRKRHLLFYMFTSLAGVNLAVLAGALAPLAGSTERFIVTAALILAYFRLVFGWLSRNMERQADLFSLEKTGTPSGLVNALEKLAISAGHIRRAASWHHMGIAERADFLRRAGRNPLVTKYHEYKVSWIMACGYVFSISVIIGMGWLIHTEYSTALATPPVVAKRDGEAHWRRVMAIMPGNPVAPLELAYQLAGDRDAQREAAELASRARNLACDIEQKTAAVKLLEELDDVRK